MTGSGTTPRPCDASWRTSCARHPELFPKAMTRGFTLCGKLPPSRKLAGHLPPPGPGHRDR